MTSTHLPFTPDWLYWRYPWLLALLALLPLVAWWRGGNRRRGALLYSDVATVASAAKSAIHWPALLPLLRMAALAALIIACARPQRADESSRTYAEGIAIQMVVDVSSSMRDEDLSVSGKRFTRLDVVKSVFRDFVLGRGSDLPGRPNDLIGMIRFARFADSVCPLTLDRSHLNRLIAETQTAIPNSPDDGTAIGDGLALAAERMKDLKRFSGSGDQYKITSRVIILLTDGENNAGEIEPVKAGELAATLGLKVYTILAGTGAMSAFGRRPVDDQELKQIAELTGGRYFHATDAAALREIYAEIDRLERTKTEERRFERYGELAAPWLLTAFACLALRTTFAATWLRRTP
ncbi:MAG: VWA domain-containing protein [Phycisphaerae bacterium]|nr:VWA domain-containing protein [Phycisphaerae bacterium]